MDFPPNPYVERKAREFPLVHTLDEAVLLAESLGITVDFVPLSGELRGILAERRGRTFIGVKRDLRECEQVQIILHEVGHFLLHADNMLFSLRLGAEHDHRREDREADYFAWLLMSDGLREEYLNPPDDGWAE